MSSLAGGGVRKGGRSETTSTYIFMMKQQKKMRRSNHYMYSESRNGNCKLFIDGFHMPRISQSTVTLNLKVSCLRTTFKTAKQALMTSREQLSIY